MNSDKEKTVSAAAERAIDIGCLALSYGILFFLPGETGFLFWLLFGVSAFLFCIGFFRIGFTFEEPAGRKGIILSGILFVLAGAVMNFTGLYAVYTGRGSGKSIAVATLLLIEALVLYAMAGSKAEAPGTKWTVSFVFRAAAVLMAAAGIVFMIRDHFEESSVFLAVMLIIEAICFWFMGRGVNPFNTMTPELRAVPELRTGIEQLQEEFAGVETQLGCPWIGKVRTLKQDSIIYGPTADGFFIYGYYLFGRFYVAGSANPLFPEAEDAQSHVTEERPDDSGILVDDQLLPEAYAQMFSRYAQSGIKKWSAAIEDRTEKTDSSRKSKKRKR